MPPELDPIASVHPSRTSVCGLAVEASVVMSAADAELPDVNVSPLIYAWIANAPNRASAEAPVVASDAPAEIEAAVGGTVAGLTEITFTGLAAVPMAAPKRVAAVAWVPA